ncbi:MAG: DotA/TraY family protein [Pseudomonadota bacterium]
MATHANTPAMIAKAAKYALLPGIVPRLRDLGLSFGYFAYLIALVFVAVRLLPATHPFFTNSRAMRDLRIGAVFVEAARHLNFSWRHSDQVIMYAVLVLGFGLILLQMIAGALALAVPIASAATINLNFTGLFDTNPPTRDIAFMMLDKTFGVPGVFGSQFDPQTWARVPAFNKAMFSLFAFYNNAMMIIALFIVFYFVVVVVLESAQTGTPFGQRFQSIYVPIRLVVAVALLLPVHYGLSAGQHLTLHIAKWGSGLATNGWKQFNFTMQNNLMVSGGNAVAKPKPADLTSLVEFMHLAQSCRAAYAINPINGVTNVDAYVIRGTRVGANGTTVNSAAQRLSGMTLDSAIAFTGGRAVQIVFGTQGQGDTTMHLAGIYPACGELTLSLEGGDTPAAKQVHAMYFDRVQTLWQDAGLRSFGERVANGFLETKATCDVSYNGSIPWGAECATRKTPGATYYRQFIDEQQSQVNAAIEDAISKLRASDLTTLTVRQEVVDRGWAGAAMVYNELAFLNGAVTTAIFATPQPSRVPVIMREAYEMNATRNAFIGGADLFNPGNGAGWSNVQKLPFAKMYYQIKDDFRQDSVANVLINGSGTDAFSRVLNMIFGSWGLFELYENRDVHPLAQMSALGKALVESSIRNLGIGLSIAGVGTGLANALNDKGAISPEAIASGMRGISGVFFTLFSITLTAGFIMYYIVPFMPFMYFLFSMVRWVLGIFQALVAVPLWALAHLRIDADGIPGKAAANGYYLLLDIFIRPILTLFGLLLAISLFSALAIMLHDVFALAISNLTGFSGSSAAASTQPGMPSLVNMDNFRGYVDQLFFTITYAILMYILASSTFKVIDAIPNSTLRFIGSGVSSFSDTNQDPAQTLVQYGAISGSMLSRDLAGDLQTAAIGMGGLFDGRPSEDEAAAAEAAKGNNQ